MPTSFWKKLRFTYLVVPVVLLISGCRANLEAVEKFGLTSSQIKAAATEMADDIYQSCMRIFWYNLPRDPKFDFVSERQNCDRFGEARERVSRANFVLVEYVESLGRLASKNTVSFDSNLNALKDSIKVLSQNSLIPIQLNQEQFQAGSSIIDSLVGIFTDNFRRENIRQIIVCTDRPIQKYIPGLNLIAQEGYIKGSLEKERLIVDSIFRDFLPDLIDNPGERAKRAEEYNQTIDALEMRKKAAQAYTELLKATAVTHAQLKTQFARSTDEAEINSYCQGYFSKTSSVAATDQAFRLDAKKIKKVNGILAQYYKTAKPLVEQMEEGFSTEVPKLSSLPLSSQQFLE